MRTVSVVCLERTLSGTLACTVKRKRRKPVNRAVLRPESRAKHGILELADKLGVGSEYRQIPESAKARMYGKPCLPPIVSFDQDTRDDVDAKAASECIRKAMKRVQLSLAEFNDVHVPLELMFSALPHLDLFLQKFTQKHPRHEPALRCRQAVQKVVRTAVPVATQALENIVISNLLPLQRFDERLYGARLKKPVHGSRRVRLEIRLFTAPPRRTQIEVDGIARPAYHCAGFLRADLIDYVSWRPRELGIDRLNEPCPVYVQSHAIDKFKERLAGTRKAPVPTSAIFQSLVNPNIVACTLDRTLLIECATPLGRLGYFLVRFLGDKFLVTTFLFLTMKGTPEADRLYERLRIGRHTVETMKLDRIETFLLSDIGKDKKISTVLRECGCGHLLSLADHMPFKHAFMMRDARRIRRILGWAKPQSEKQEMTMEQIEKTLEDVRAMVAKADSTPGALGRMLRQFTDQIPRDALAKAESILQVLNPRK